MTPSDHRHFHPLFTTSMLVLGLIALAIAQNSPAARSGQPPNAVAQLLSGKGRTMIGQTVTLSKVAIHVINQNDIVWVGGSPNSSVMVMLQPSVNPIDAQGNPTPIRAGDQVRITGHVLRAPSAQVLQSWGVSPADAARVQLQGAVVQAVTFEVLNRNQ